MIFNKLIAGAFAAGLVVAISDAAHAVSFSFTEDANVASVGSVTATAVTELDTLIDFQWDSAPVTQYISFTVRNEFDLFLLEYIDNSSNTSFASAYTLDVLDGADGNVVQRLTNQANACGVADAPISGFCNFIADEDGSTGPAATAAKPSLETALFEDLAGGSYRLGFFERGNPTIGSATFAVAAVPLPAGLILILSGLGVMGLISRRKPA